MSGNISFSFDGESNVVYERGGQSARPATATPAGHVSQLPAIMPTSGGARLPAANIPIMDMHFWQTLCPDCHIADANFVRQFSALNLSAPQLADMRTRVLAEGYAQEEPLTWGVPVGKLAAAIERVHQAGLLPVFAFMYDEFWLPFIQLAPIIKTILGGDYRMLPDFWAWRIDPARAEYGWRPHRDKGRLALFADGAPKSLTVWLPLTDATTLNGCMYMVPSDRDPTYNSANEKDWRMAYPDIRALPARAGGMLAWNQAVLHWGSHASTRGGKVRISIAFEFQRSDVPPFNVPLLPPVTFPSLQQRQLLIAKQTLQYAHMYPLAEDIKAQMQSIRDAHQSLLTQQNW